MRFFRLLSVLTIAAVVAGLTACNTVKVKSDWDRSADFSGYKTWSFSKGSDPPRSIPAAVVNEAIEEDMTAKGFTKVSAEPDLIVIPYGSSGQAIRTEHFEWGYGAQPGGGWYWGGTGFTMRDIAVGSILVDIIDLRGDYLVWRGLAEGEVLETAAADKRIQRVKTAVKEMMRSFPPK